jgi:membrane-bound serine protease (ClpP class)
MQIGDQIVSAWLIVLVILLLVAFAAITIILGIRAHMRKVDAGTEEMVGRSAEVKTPLRPRGSVFVEGELWTAVSETGNIEAGEEVVIKKVNGMVLTVARTK